MEEEFYSIIKLISGEEILSLVSVDDNDGDPILLLQNPIIMKMIHTPHGIHVKVKSWMELSSDNLFIIRRNEIITMTETKDKKLINIYNDYIEDNDNPIELNSPSTSGKTKPCRKMGYLSSVEEARKTLENIFKLTDTKEG